MFNFIGALKSEFVLYYKQKRNYHYQTIAYFIQRVIFLVGMFWVAIMANNVFDSILFIKITFWFCLINNIYALSKRIESEHRLHQHIHCFNLKISYWLQTLIRALPVLLESFITCFCALLFIQVPRLSASISLLSFIIYIVVASIQFILFHYLFVFIVLYFVRIQAVLGFIESFTFFYTGMVLIPNNYQFFIFKWMDQILYNQYPSLFYLIIIIGIEILFIYLGITYFNRKIKLRG